LTAPVASSGGATSFLEPGTYVIHIGDWTTTQASKVTYQLAIKLLGVQDNPPPLTLGPVPAISIRLVSASQGATDSSAEGSSPPAVTINTPATGVAPPPAAGDPKTTVVPPSGTPAPAPITGTSQRPALPVALVVALVAPSGVTTFGIPPTPTASAPYRPSQVSTPAPGVLLVLGVGPVGGVQDPAAIDNSQQVERPVVRVIDGLFRPEAPRHSLFGQTVHSGTAALEGSKSSPAEESSWSSESSPGQTPDTNSEVNGLDISRLPVADQQISSSCLQGREQVTDTVFSLPNWLNQPRGGAPRLTLQPENRILRPGQERGSYVGNSVLASAVATVAFAILSPNKRQLGRPVVDLRRSKPKSGAPKGVRPPEPTPWTGFDPSWG